MNKQERKYFLVKLQFKGFFDKINRITKKNGVVFFNVFVEKSFLELPPDWDLEEKMWKSGDHLSVNAG